MEAGYWGLFWQTGAPMFYLLQTKSETARDASERNGQKVRA